MDFKQAICFEFIIQNINPDFETVWDLNGRLVTFKMLPEDKDGNRKVYFTDSNGSDDFQFTGSVELLAKTLHNYQEKGFDRFTCKYSFSNDPKMLLLKVDEFIQTEKTNIESIEFNGCPTLYEFKDLYSKVELPFSLLKLSQNQIDISKDYRHIEDLHMLPHMLSLLFL